MAENQILHLRRPVLCVTLNLIFCDRFFCRKPNIYLFVMCYSLGIWYNYLAYNEELAKQYKKGNAADKKKKK